MARRWERRSERSSRKVGLSSLGEVVARESRKRLMVWRIVRTGTSSRSLDEMDEADEDEDEDDDVDEDEETERERWWWYLLL